MLHKAFLDGITWNRDHTEFLDKCIGMVEDWANLELECDPYISEYGRHHERCQLAVNLALPSLRVEGDAGLMTRMINYHSRTTIQDLHCINLNDAAIRTYAGRRLFTSWLVFELQREQIKTAQATLQPQAADPTQSPENLMAETADTSASTPSTLAGATRLQPRRRQ